MPLYLTGAKRMQQINAPGVRWEWISEAWNLFTKQWSVWVLMILALFAVVVVGYIPMIVLGMMAGAAAGSDEGGGLILTLVSLYPLLFGAILLVAMPWLMGGLYNAAFKQIRGEQIAFGDVLSGGKYFPRILGASLLIGIAASIGSFCLVIPGLIVGGLTFLTIPMIVEGGKGTIDAIKASIEVTKKDWIMFTVFALALGFVAGIGGVACGIGALATYPLLFLGHALAYRDLVGVSGAPAQGQFSAPPPPPDYRNYTPTPTPAAQEQ